MPGVFAWKAFEQDMTFIADLPGRNAGHFYAKIFVARHSRHREGGIGDIRTCRRKRAASALQAGSIPAAC